MKTYFSFIISLMFLTACTAQEEKGNQSASNKTKASETEQPVISWKVNKVVDKDGNILRYDSTYTWSYTSFNGDSMLVDVDSVMLSFNKYFDQQFPEIWNESFRDPFRNDSTLYREFFSDNYFQNRYKTKFFNIENLFLKMDSLRNRFFRESFPGLLESAETDKKTN